MVSVAFSLKSVEICKNNDHTCLVHCIYTCREAAGSVNIDNNVRDCSRYCPQDHVYTKGR